MGEVYFILIMIIVFSSPIILTIFNIFNVISKKKIAECFIQALTLVLGTFLSWLVITASEINNFEYDEPITIYFSSKPQYHAFISGEYKLSFWMPLIIGIVSLLIMSLWNKYKTPLVSFLLMGSVYISNILMLVGMIQLAKHKVFMFWGLAVFCLNYFIVTISVGMREIKMFLKIYNENDIIPIRKWTLKLYKILFKTSNSKFFSIIGMLPVSIILYLILLLLGQGPAGFIKAFTETADWTFSQHIPPPNEYADGGHYLCTVAAEGHKKLVKPLRTGIRHGRIIKVNRQLCIANAFEEIVSEKAPRLHKVIRNFYDKHGYPLSKKITTSFRADIVYILMKPLEYIFNIVIYLTDKNPENRIAVQYTNSKNKLIMKKECEK